MAINRVLLVHNSPRVGRYFARLAEAISHPEIVRCRVGARLSGAAPPDGTIEEIIDYGMRRKRARARYGSLRLAAFRGLYAAAARLHYDHVKGRIARHRPDALGVWGGNAVDAKAVVLAARHAGLPCFQFENGFLPNTTQMDPRGVNVESSVPRDPAFYANRPKGSRRQLPSVIAPRAPKGRKRRSHIEPTVLPERYVFVPFQVKLDSQVLLHSPWIAGMHELFRVATEAARRASGGPVDLVFKEHPSCPVRYADLRADASSTAHVTFANGNSTDELIRNALGVITLNSTVGTESLLLEKPVLALGNAVYEVPGVASSARSVGEIVAWLENVWEGRPPAAPLREPFLEFLIDEYLIPGRHQAPGPEHFAAVAERLAAPDEIFGLEPATRTRSQP